jgi:hypothetical protein
LSEQLRAVKGWDEQGRWRVREGWSWERCSVDRDHLEVGFQLLPQGTMLPLQLLEGPHAAAETKRRCISNDRSASLDHREKVAGHLRWIGVASPWHCQ